MKNKVKYRHNKRRNVGFIFEVLTRTIAKSVIEGDKKRKEVLMSVINEHFNQKSSLFKELEVYNTILEISNIDNEKMAEKILAEAKLKHSRIDSQKLFVEQSKLIDVINKVLSKDLYSSFVPNYRSLATISQILNNDIPVKDRVLLEDKLIKEMMNKQKTELELESIDNIAMRNFLEKFNEKYSFLFKPQKKLLENYIFSFLDNGVRFKLFLNEEISRLKELVNDSLTLDDISNDSTICEKLNKILELLDSYSQKNPDHAMIEELLKIQKLSEEILENNDNKV